mmetsp:Transcript_36720/g.63372  ORF Transcript_36720/g.63372 Transcript_36720/m.63372 type:complete len:239 (+) Transcript_36720:1117-1833(+)
MRSLGPTSLGASVALPMNMLAMPDIFAFIWSMLSEACLRAVAASPIRSRTCTWPCRRTSPVSQSMTTVPSRDSLRSSDSKYLRTPIMYGVCVCSKFNSLPGSKGMKAWCHLKGWSILAAANTVADRVSASSAIKTMRFSHNTALNSLKKRSVPSVSNSGRMVLDIPAPALAFGRTSEYSAYMAEMVPVGMTMRCSLRLLMSLLRYTQSMNWRQHPGFSSSSATACSSKSTDRKNLKKG